MGINLDKNSCTIVTSGTEQLIALIEPPNITNSNVIWVSSNEAIATVDSNGLVLATGVGDATITVTTEDGGFIDNCSVSVPKLTASDAVAYDIFGNSVSISNDYALIGTHGDDNNIGSAYIFYRNQGGTDNWGQVTKLTASDPGKDDYFGSSVSINGDYALIGANGDDNNSGSAYIFYRNQGGTDNWGQITKLTASDATEGDTFGSSVSINDEFALIGAAMGYGSVNNSGSAYLFVVD